LWRGGGNEKEKQGTPKKIESHEITELLAGEEKETREQRRGTERRGKELSLYGGRLRRCVG